MVLTLVCFFDAARHKRQNVGPYLFGMILLPGLSVIVGLVYLSRREEFSQREVSTPEVSHVTPGTGCEVQVSGDKILWNSQVRGWATLPRRLSYTLAYKEDVWMMAIFASVPLLYAVVSSQPSIVLASVGLVSLPWLTHLSNARTFTDTTVEVDTETGIRGVSFHGGDSPLVPGYGFLTGSAEDITPGILETVEIAKVGKQHIAWFTWTTPTCRPLPCSPFPGSRWERFRTRLSDTASQYRTELRRHDRPIYSPADICRHGNVGSHSALCADTLACPLRVTPPLS